MKTINMKMRLIAGLLLISTLAVANDGKKSRINSEELKVTVTPNQFNNVLVHVYKQEGEEVKIKVYDRRGDLLHQERISENDEILQPYDLSELPQGEYTFEVSNDIFRMKKTVETK